METVPLVAVIKFSLAGKSTHNINEARQQLNRLQGVFPQNPGRITRGLFSFSKTRNMPPTKLTITLYPGLHRRRPPTPGPLPRTGKYFHASEIADLCLSLPADRRVIFLGLTSSGRVKFVGNSSRSSTCTYPPTPLSIYNSNYGCI